MNERCSCLYLSTTGMDGYLTYPPHVAGAVIIILLRGIEVRGVETPPGYRENHIPQNLPALCYTCAYPRGNLLSCYM